MSERNFQNEYENKYRTAKYLNRLAAEIIKSITELGFYDSTDFYMHGNRDKHKKIFQKCKSYQVALRDFKRE